MAGPKRFDEMPELSKETLAVLDKLGFMQATPVQEATIPLFCGHKDVAVDACTGSGKTLAFVLPIIEKMRKLEEKLKLNQVGAIIVCPTRELAKQIHSVAQPFVESLPGLNALLLVGGTDPAEDVAIFKNQGGHILIGTPGRIDDIMKRCTTMDVKRLEMLVLDEADRLLDMGFKVQVDAIMARLPKQRRTGLFSATQTEAVEALARAGLRNPVRVKVAVTAAPTSTKKKSKTKTASGEEENEAPKTVATPSGLQIQYVMCDVDQKLGQVVAFLQKHKDQKIMVYFLTCACVDYFGTVIKQLNELKDVHISVLHGKMKQAARETTLATYASEPAGVMLCTDLAARGLDIPDIHWIVQYDPPQDPAAFIHRVGRTARMGRSGQALVYLQQNEQTYVDFLTLRKVPLTEGSLYEDAPDLGGRLRKMAENDREVMEKSVKCFISFIRGYKEHHCKFIFRIQDLELGKLATSLGLLRLPKMPEVKKSKMLEGFTASTVDPESVKFKDKTREKQRQQTLKRKAEAQQEEEETAPKPQPKRVVDAKAQNEARLPAAKRRMLQERDELDELTEDYKAYKKLKKGKISVHEANVAMGFSSDSDLDEPVPQPSSNKSKTAPSSSKKGGVASAGNGAKSNRKVFVQQDSSDDDSQHSDDDSDDAGGKEGGKFGGKTKTTRLEDYAAAKLRKLKRKKIKSGKVKHAKAA